jgi:hypothetical protein
MADGGSARGPLPCEPFTATGSRWNGRKPSLLDTARKEWATVGAFLLGLLVPAASQFVPELPPG